MNVVAVDAFAYIDAIRKDVNEGLSELAFPREPVELYEPVRYVLAGHGKRMRPILLMLAARMFGAGEKEALPAALAVEVFHNFTLVHDDIMDHAAERRGRPTVHIKWDQNTAILCGDLLMGLSYDLLARVDTPELAKCIRIFHRMVTRLCEGQALDEAFEHRQDVSLGAYQDMISKKTSALLEATLELGGIIGSASEDDLKRIKRIGFHMGLGFQIQDDLLDLTAKDKQWGKTIGGDLMEGKKTYLLIKTLEVAPPADRAWFVSRLNNGGLGADEIDEARKRMNQLGVLDSTHDKAQQHYNSALQILEELPQGLPNRALYSLILRMKSRVR